MSDRLTLQDLVDLLSNKQNVTKKDAETFLRELVTLISETIEQKDFVRIKDFGTFKLTPVSARRSVDVNTGDPIEIRAHYKLSFTPEKVLREGVNRPFSHFDSILLDDEVVFEDKEIADSRPAVKPVPKKAEVKPIETPKPVLTPKVEEEEIEEVDEVVEVDEVEFVVKKEEEEEVVAIIAADNVPKEKGEIKVDAAEEEIAATVETTVLENQVVKESDELQREKELADINSFLSQNIEDKKEETPAITPTNPVEQKETVIPTPRKMVSQYDDDDDDDFVDYEYIAQQKKKRNIWIAVGFLILALLCGGIWGYNYLDQQPDVIPYAQDNSKITITEDEKPATQQPATVDPILTEEPQPNVVTPPVAQEQPITTPAVSAKPEQGAREIEVKAGQTMRVLGMEYFGHGSFWVYIFEENRDKISRPDAVFAGMKLIIPPASKYGIDANDKDAVRKAQRQELKLFGEFSDK